MRILIVEDHRLFREALTLLLRDFNPAATVIEASSAEEAISALGFYDDFDLILLDLGLPGLDGLSALPKLRDISPTTPVVVLSGRSDVESAQAALAAGAAGFLQKTIGSEEMRNALRLVLEGEIYAPLALLTTATVPACSEPPTEADARLTQRQLEVLELMSKGMPNKSIARELALSEGTVKLHVSAIFRALEVRNRTEAVLEATRRGLFPEGRGTD